MIGNLSLLELVAVVFVASILHAFLCRRLFYLTEPLRHDLALRGELLLHDNRLGVDDRKIVESMLKHSYNRWLVPVMVIAFPFCIIYATIAVVIITLSGKEKPSLFGKIDDPQLRSERNLVGMAFAASVASISPLSTCVLALELILIAMLGLPLKRTFGLCGIWLTHRVMHHSWFHP